MTGHGAMQHGAVPAAQAGDHAAMGHGAPAPTPPPADAARLAELHGRMMADPVIRARVAADSAMRRMTSEVHGEAPAPAADSAQALDFVVRLLADPQVEARIHSDPRLHALWSDPEVQRRLAELRRAQPARPAAPAAEPHRH